jgi:hypothetical protein
MRLAIWLRSGVGEKDTWRNKVINQDLKSEIGLLRQIILLQ